MKRSKWWILGVGVLAVAGCGRPESPNVAKGTARINSAIPSVASSEAATKNEGDTAKDAEGEKSELLKSEPAKQLGAEDKSEIPPARFSLKKSASGESRKADGLAAGTPLSESRDNYRNHISEAKPASASSSPSPGSVGIPVGGQSVAGGMVGGSPFGNGAPGGIGGAPGVGGDAGGNYGGGRGGRPVDELSRPEGIGFERMRSDGEGRDYDNRFVPGGEAYEKIAEKKFSRVLEEPLSTFSIDVDTASYANVRRFLTQRALPPPDAVRIEELVNYFTYDYAPPSDDKPFASSAEVAGCPWNPQHRLVRIGLKGKVIENEARPVSNLVFLIDVSGSMQGSNRLPLVKHSLRMLTEKLGENDRVAMVVYAGSSGLVLDSTSGVEKAKILGALDNLQAGGSTNGAGGIQQAYEVAVANFIKGGVNRVILCTDGDFNVGVTDRSQLVNIIENNAKTGVFLSVLGFGMGNLKDATMEQLADKGNGNYAYIDTPLEAKKVLVDQMSGTLVTIAKDVKIQVEFNPAKAAAYRLVGYENRMLAAQDFTDDKKDAGEIGAGHTVTALYEVIPAGLNIPGATPELKYQKPATATTPNTEFSDELLTVKLRYKRPDGDVSTELSFPLKDEGNGFGKASADFRWATSVAAFGMLLRNSDSKGDMTLEAIKEWAQTAVGSDKNGYRREFMHLIDSALNLAGSTHLSDARPR